jgi:hypothetical protein
MLPVKRGAEPGVWVNSVTHFGDGVLGMLTYYDDSLGRVRFKRRYVWALWAFVAGMVFGTVLGHVI